MPFLKNSSFYPERIMTLLNYNFIRKAHPLKKVTAGDFESKNSLGAQESGFTLVEILVAVVILAIGLFLFLSTSGSIMTRNQKSSNETIATTLAQDKLELIQNTALTVSLSGADGLASPSYSSGWTANASGETIDASGNTGTPGAHFTRTWSIAADGTLFFYYLVTVTVTWNNGANSVVLTTQISQ
ncbi:MAG: hypothetical protein COV66_11995 [Nitrospinae bacterium CG11_big_fil_rev_8_21_14_0_20_45_15]|nr:MAG: hypothetical protein COV66_11995 [Nitrospinae bacterium CG11_big_fil_rev_8_21_14_0_20_45_15]